MQTVFRWCIPLQIQATPRCYLMASCSMSTHQTLSRITGVWKSRRGGLITEHISEPTSIPTTSKRTAEKSCSIWPAHWADCVGCGAGWRLGVHCHCGCNNLGSNRWVFWSGAEQRHYTRNATPTTSCNKSVLCNLLSNASNDTVRLSQFLYTSPVGSKDSDAYLQWIWTNELFNSSKIVLYLSSMVLFSVLWEFMLKYQSVESCVKRFRSIKSSTGHVKGLTGQLPLGLEHCLFLYPLVITSRKTLLIADILVVE